MHQTLDSGNTGETGHQNLQRQQEKLITEYGAAGNTKLAKKIWGMKQAERINWVFQQRHAARQQDMEGGLTHVLVPVNPNNNSQ